MAAKRKQDEKHLKMLRDMVALPHNKQCFDCHQRGPTYVNMTIGSYVCTACSGILRGINPPHRVKSISMASFTPEEIDFIKDHGNEFCRKVWLGLYDSRTDPSEPDARDEQKIKDFMAQKYERKRWYVAPTDAMKQEAHQMHEAATNRQPASRPLKTLLGDKTPKLVVQNQSPQSTPKNQAAQQPPPISQSTAQKSFPSPGQQSQSSQSSGSVTMDLLGDLGGDPFASSTPAAPPPAAPVGGGGGEGGFADFSSFNSSQFPSQPASQPFPTFQTSNSSTLLPIGTTPASTAPAVNGAFGNFPTATAAPPASNTAAPQSGADKYSVLGDLFSTPATSTSDSSSATVNWGGDTGGGSSGGINWGGGSNSSGGIDWNSTGSSGGGSTGFNWNSSGTTNPGGGSTSINWNSSSSSQATGLSNTAFPFQCNSYHQGTPGNPFFSDSSGANPFGGTSTPSQSTMSGPGMGQSNPFGGTAGGQSLFGSQPTSGFGQPTPGSGFGQPAASSGFGQPTPGSGFGQPSSVPGFGQQTSMAGGFGQQPGQQANTSANFGAFGQSHTAGGGFGQPVSSVGGFGQAPAGFGQPVSSSQGSFNQFGLQNGGSGFNSMGPASSTSAGFGAFPQSQTMPAQFGNSIPGQFDNKMGGGSQGFPAGWGQPASNTGQTVNPFMSAASQPVAPKSGSTNPFL